MEFSEIKYLELNLWDNIESSKKGEYFEILLKNIANLKNLTLFSFNMGYNYLTLDTIKSIVIEI